MRCDLHVHTIHSGMCTLAPFRAFTRECYSDPDALYDTLTERGMDLVTVTDHDSIGAADRLGRHSNFFLSEEVTCVTPSGTEAHIAVYDINQRQHGGLQERRNDLPRLAAWLREQRLFASVNHAASSLTGPRRREDFEAFARFEAMEALNGQVSERSNGFVRDLAATLRKPALAGSDSHTLRSAGRAYTEVPGARDHKEFFVGLRAGRGRLCGSHGGWINLTRDVLNIAGSLVREQPAALVLAPLVALIPGATGLQFLIDQMAARHWERMLPASQARTLAGATTCEAYPPVQ